MTNVVELVVVVADDVDWRKGWLMDCFVCTPNRRLCARLGDNTETGDVEYFYEKRRALDPEERRGLLPAFVLTAKTASGEILVDRKEITLLEPGCPQLGDDEAIGFDLFRWEVDPIWTEDVGVSRICAKITIPVISNKNMTETFVGFRTDLEGVALGHVTIVKNPRGNGAELRRRRAEEDKIYDRMVALEHAFYHEFSVKKGNLIFLTEGTRSHVYSPDHIPARRFKDLPPFVYPNEYVRNAPAIEDGWFDYFYDAALTIRVRTNTATAEESKGTVTARVAFEACALWVQTHYYADDHDNYLTNDFISTATNCKDKSATIMYILSALMHGPSAGSAKQSPRVTAMRNVTNEFIPFTVGGLLGGMPHCFVMCVRETPNPGRTDNAFLLDGTRFQSADFADTCNEGMRTVLSEWGLLNTDIVHVEPRRCIVTCKTDEEGRRSDAYSTVSSVWTWKLRERFKDRFPHFAYVVRAQRPDLCDTCSGKVHGAAPGTSGTSEPPTWGAYLSEFARDWSGTTALHPRVAKELVRNPIIRDDVYRKAETLYRHNRPSPRLFSPDARPLSELVPSGKFTSCLLLHKPKLESLRSEIENTFPGCVVESGMKGGSAIVFVR